MIFWLFIIPVLIFLFVFTIERRTIWIGFLFILLMGYLSLLTTISLERIHQQIAVIFLAILAAFVILLMPFYILSFIIALITSGIRLIKREGRKLHNFLGIALGFFIIAWTIVISVVVIPPEKTFLSSIYFFITFSVTYIFLLMVCFAIAAILNRFRNPFKKYDYIIVLGSGLIGERVPPLLASRIDKGIEIFHQHHKKNHPVKIVFTGGQGHNELVAEGSAMAKYAREQGLNDTSIIIEDQAINTYENLLFSKRLIDADRKSQNQKSRSNIITVTNNFHVFRSLLWARRVGLKTDGAGSKTKFYFWLNALIREFIGVLYMQRKFHIIVFLLFALAAIAVFFLTEYAVVPEELR